MDEKKVLDIKDLSSERKHEAALLAKNWNNILQAVMYKLRADTIELTWDDLRSCLNDDSKLAIAIREDGLTLCMMTDAEAETMAQTPGTTVADVALDYNELKEFEKYDA